VALTGRGVLLIVGAGRDRRSRVSPSCAHTRGVVGGEINQGVTEVLRKEYDLDRGQCGVQGCRARGCATRMQSKEVSALLLVAP